MGHHGERPNRKEFREDTIAQHKDLFGSLFCRIGGQAFDNNGKEIPLQAHHTGETYQHSPNSNGKDNGTLIGAFCHQELLHGGHRAETELTRKLAEQFKNNPSQRTYPQEEIDCSQCGNQSRLLSFLNAKNKSSKTNQR